MAEMSRTFNEFWDGVDDLLADNDEVMARIRPLSPGSIGSVAAQPTLDLEPLPDPPEAA